MHLETAFRIYRRLLRKAPDFCEQMVVEKDPKSDYYDETPLIIVRFVPRKPRELTRRESGALKEFCKHHKLEYRMNKKGEMEWQHPK